MHINLQLQNLNKGVSKMPKRKIDLPALASLLREGKSNKQCAKFFKCTEPAISQARKRLKIATTKNVTLESAHEVVHQNIDIVAQMQKINDCSHQILDGLVRLQNGDPEALENHQKLAGIFDTKDPRELAFKAVAEIRAQCKLQLDILKDLYNADSVKEFQHAVLDAIGEADIATRDRIIQNMQQRQAIRSVVALDP
jgi:hypothetical protein